MDNKFYCNLGSPSERPQYPHSQVECQCADSCEPHIHEPDGILCLHDGESDHGHCPNG